MELIHAMADKSRGIWVLAGVGDPSWKGHELLSDMQGSGMLARIAGASMGWAARWALVPWARKFGSAAMPTP